MKSLLYIQFFVESIEILLPMVSDDISSYILLAYIDLRLLLNFLQFILKSYPIDIRIL